MEHTWLLISSSRFLASTFWLSSCLIIWWSVSSSFWWFLIRLCFNRMDASCWLTSVSNLDFELSEVIQKVEKRDTLMPSTNNQHTRLTLVILLVLHLKNQSPYFQMKHFRSLLLVHCLLIDSEMTRGKIILDEITYQQEIKEKLFIQNPLIDADRFSIERYHKNAEMNVTKRENWNSYHQRAL